jgi:L-2-hydroxyglutarate oxidase LhgO
MKNIAVIGGGVAGATAALYLSKIGLNVTLFEKNDTLISGPPFCHLHSGGNLYREISDEQRVTLLHQSIDLLKFYPFAIDSRPTILITPKSDPQDPQDLIPRLEQLKNEYEKAVKDDISNRVLGDVDEYFKVYDKEDIQRLQKLKPIQKPTTLDEWMILPIKNIDINQIKFPIIIVQEYGLNLFRLSAAINLEFAHIQNCRSLLNSEVTSISKDVNRYKITYNKTKSEYFDYIINAAGYLTGSIDNMLGFKRDRFVEFKSAYVTKWKDSSDALWAEIIFFGKRGTPNGMGQFTPYADGYFQLHGMTNDITLFENGLVKSCSDSAQPKLQKSFIDKIDSHWSEDEVKNRTSRAIEHIASYIPSFSSAEVASKPLYGAQQIPGNDEDLRAADVSFEDENYARCEVVKASSVLDMIDKIMLKLVELKITSKDNLYKRDFEFKFLENHILDLESKKICESREYPSSLALLNVGHELMSESEKS